MTSEDRHHHAAAPSYTVALAHGAIALFPIRDDTVRDIAMEYDWPATALVDTLVLLARDDDLAWAWSPVTSSCWSRDVAAREGLVADGSDGTATLAYELRGDGVLARRSLGDVDA